MLKAFPIRGAILTGALCAVALIAWAIILLANSSGAAAQDDMPLPTLTPFPPPAPTPTAVPDEAEPEEDGATGQAQTLPTITLVRTRSSVVEGNQVRFKLTASPTSTAKLLVTVKVTQTGSFLTGWITDEIGFGPGNASETLILNTEDDSTAEADGSVTASIVAGSNYKVGNPSSATILVRDNDSQPTGPFVSITRYLSPLTEGHSPYFQLTASYAPSSTLQVNVRITQSPSSFLTGDIPAQVDIDAESTSTWLGLYTSFNTKTEADRRVTVTVLSGAGYRVGSPSSAVVVVKDPLPTAPAPSGLTVRSATHSSVSLTWSRLTGAASYQLRYRQSGVARWTTIQVQITGTSFRVPGLLSGKNHDFQVRARGNGVKYKTSPGPWSGTASGYTPSVSITGLSTSLNVGQSDAFTVKAKGMKSNLRYRLSVYADEETGLSGQADGDAAGSEDSDEAALPAALSSNCTDKAKSTNIPANSTEYSWSLTLETCAAGSTKLTAFLSDNVGAVDLTSYREVARHEVSVTVNTASTPDPSPRPTPTPTPTPEPDPEPPAPPPPPPAKPEITIVRTSDAEITEGTAAAFKLTARPAPSSAISVKIGVSDTGSVLVSTATNTVTIASGTTTASFSLSTYPDKVDEANATVTARILSGTGYRVNSPSSASVTVKDDDTPALSIEASPADPIVEGIGEGGSAIFKVKADIAPYVDLSVNISISQTGTYLTRPGQPSSLNLSAGATTANLYLPTENDLTDEPNGRVTVRIETGNGYALSASSSAAIVIKDNDTPAISIAASSTSTTEGNPAVFTLNADIAPYADLSVNIDVTDKDGFLDGTAPTTTTLTAGATTTSLSLATDDDSKDEKNGKVTVAIQAGQGYNIGSASTTSVTITDNDLPKLATPTGFDVVPFGGRKAKISWAPVQNVGEYIVEIRETGASWASKTTSTGTTTHHIFNLDQIIPGQGLAQHPAYEFRVKAKTTGTSFRDSNYSITVIVIDTPIYRADGDSRGASGGKAVVKWNRIPTASNSVPPGGEYTVSYRMLLPFYDTTSFVKYLHSDDSAGWKLDPKAGYGTSTPANAGASTSHTLTGLKLRQIYAIRVDYKVVSVDLSSGESAIGAAVFSARDVYVWPAVAPPGDQNRVATFPLSRPVPGKTYRYAICTETFPAARKNEWADLIVHALDQWTLATDGLVTMQRMVTDIGGFEPCADYTDAIKEIHQKASTTSLSLHGKKAKLATSTIQRLFSQITGLTMIQDKDKTLSEIKMFRSTTAVSINLKAYGVYHGFAAALGFNSCVMIGVACAVPQSSNPVIIDILFNLDHHKYNSGNPRIGLPGGDTSVDKSDTPFNTCPTNVVNKALYGDLIHEAGHALGIRLGRGNHPILSQHPGIADSVMNYISEADCSPYPFDIMAIYALYQTVD